MRPVFLLDFNCVVESKESKAHIMFHVRESFKAYVKTFKTLLKAFTAYGKHLYICVCEREL